MVRLADSLTIIPPLSMARGQQRVTEPLVASSRSAPSPSPGAPTPPSQVTWAARAAVRSGSSSGRAPRSGPNPAPAPAPAPRAPDAKGPCRCLRAVSIRGRPFLLRARDCLLPRRPEFNRRLLGAVAVTGVGSTLPEGPFRPVSHGRVLGAPRAPTSGAANPGHRQAAQRAPPPPAGPCLRAPAPRTGHALFAARMRALPPGSWLTWGPGMQSVPSGRSACAGGAGTFPPAPGTPCLGEQRSQAVLVQP